MSQSTKFFRYEEDELLSKQLEDKYLYDEPGNMENPEDFYTSEVYLEYIKNQNINRE